MRGVTYATIEIIVLIVLAAIIGFLIGWILRRFLYDVDLGAYEARIAAADAAVREAAADGAAAGAQLVAATAELEDARTKVAETAAQVAALTSEREAAVGRVASLEGEVREAKARVAEAGDRAGSLTADLDAALDDARAKEATIARLEAELAGAGALQEQVDSRAARIAELEVLVVEKDTGAASRLAALEEELRVARDEHAACATQLEARDARIAELEAARGAEAPAAAPAAPGAPSRDEAVAAMAAIAARTAGTEPAVDDDLKQIHGVGPKLERLLKSMGITSFAQVARFEVADIATVTAALDAFPGRIERDDWMSSAAEEHEKKYGIPVRGT